MTREQSRHLKSRLEQALTERRRALALAPSPEPPEVREARKAAAKADAVINRWQKRRAAKLTRARTALRDEYDRCMREVLFGDAASALRAVDAFCKKAPAREV